MRPTYYEVPLPDFLDNTIEVFDSSNESLLANVPASVLQGQPFFRDVATDVAFLVNETAFISIVPNWTGQPGDLRIEWAEYLTDVVFWAYALHRYGKQWLVICAPAGSPSLTPPVAVEGGGGGASIIFIARVIIVNPETFQLDVYSNTLGGNVTVTRDAIGIYYMNSDALFPDSTVIHVNHMGFGDRNAVTCAVGRVNANQIGLDFVSGVGDPYDPSGFFITIQTF